MAKIVLLLLISTLFSCSTTKKDGGEMTTSTGLIKEGLKSKDRFFRKVFKSSCINDWDKRVGEIKVSLGKLPSEEARAGLWYELGQCFLIGGNLTKANYYYDLYLGSGLSTADKKSSILSNLGLYYEKHKLYELSYNYYRNALSVSNANDFARFLVANYYLRSMNAKEAFKELSYLHKSYPKSRLVLSALGVAAYNSQNYQVVKNKVLPHFVEKDSEKVLFELALKLIDNKDVEKIRGDIKDLDFEFAFLNNFKEQL